MVDARQLGQQYAAQYGAPWEYFDPLIRQESGWQHFNKQGGILTSKMGALGIGQLMPKTAAGLGVNPRDLVQNLRGAAQYLGQQFQRYAGDPVRSVAAYNAGPGNIDKWNGTRIGLRQQGLSETEKYLDAIIPRWDQGIISPVPGGSGGWLPTPSDIGQGIWSGITGGLASTGQAIAGGLAHEMVEHNAWWWLTIGGIVLLASGAMSAATGRSPAGNASMIIDAVAPAPVRATTRAVGIR